MLLAAVFSFWRFTFSPFLRKPPAFCTILPFYFGCQLVIFQPQIRIFTPKTLLFDGRFAPFSHVFHA